jgi:hypothetical protein
MSSSLFVRSLSTRVTAVKSDFICARETTHIQVVGGGYRIDHFAILLDFADESVDD